jgi:hypothetical protein
MAILRQEDHRSGVTRKQKAINGYNKEPSGQRRGWFIKMTWDQMPNAPSWDEGGGWSYLLRERQGA